MINMSECYAVYHVLFTKANMEKYQKGFSLMELIITMLIIGIITMFTYPNYKNHIIKIRRLDGMSALYDLANRLENYYLINKSYEKASIATGLTTDVLSSNCSPDKWYKLDIITANKTEFIIQATAINNQAHDMLCQSFTLDNSGVKKSSPELCW